MIDPILLFHILQLQERPEANDVIPHSHTI